MKLNLLILLALVLTGFGAAALLQQPEPAATPSGPAAQQLAPAPDFTFTDLSGRAHKRSDYAGKTVILNFWASWCAPCVAEFPLLLETAAKTQAILIALSSDDNAAAVERFLLKLDAKSQKILKQNNIIIALDPDKAITSDLFQTVSLPETVIIGPSGLMTHKIIGAVENAETLQEHIK